jgi:Domain of unknown function (DUF5615)
MLRLFVDHDFNENILQGLRQRVPELEAVTARDYRMSRSPDPDLLARASEEGRLIITHDQRTMPGHVADRIIAGENVAGVVIVPQDLPIGRAIDDLEIIVNCSSADEWINIIQRLPL